MINMIQSNDIRLAVDTGEVALGAKQVMKSIERNLAKLIIIATGSKEDIANDIKYFANISEMKVEKFIGNSMELGSICGKPYSVSMLAIINQGNSNILNLESEKTILISSAGQEREENKEQIIQDNQYSETNLKEI